MLKPERFLSKFPNGHTRRNYDSILQAFQKFLGGQEPSEALAEEWVASLRGGIGTRNVAISALRGYLRALGQEPEGLALLSYRAPRQPVMRWDDRQRLIDAAKNPRDKCLLTLLVYSGCRWEGLQNLRWGGVHLVERELETIEKRGIRRTRDSKLGPVLINQACVQAIEAYQGTLKGPAPDSPVFSITYRTALRILKDCAKRTGVDGIKGLHSVRRGFATHQYHQLKGATPQDIVRGMEAIRRSMSHTNITTTAEYVYQDLEDTRRAYDELVGDGSA